MARDFWSQKTPWTLTSSFHNDLGVGVSQVVERWLMLAAICVSPAPKARPSSHMVIERCQFLEFADGLQGFPWRESRMR